jgi:hypothetical protein
MLPTKFRLILLNDLKYEADLSASVVEADFIQGLLKNNEKKLAQSFNFTFRYIDDVLSLNNSMFGDFVDRIYPLAKRFQRRRFIRNRQIRNKNCLWRPCLLTDWDEMNNFYKGPEVYRAFS